MQRRCLNCFNLFDIVYSDKEEREVCPYCGYCEGTPPKELYHLFRSSCPLIFFSFSLRARTNI